MRKHVIKNLPPIAHTGRTHLVHLTEVADRNVIWSVGADFIVDAETFFYRSFKMTAWATQMRPSARSTIVGWP